jgi:hypothetical protein
VCACEAIGASLMLRFTRGDSVLGEDVTDLRFEMGVKSNTEEAELALVVLCMFNS